MRNISSKTDNVGDTLPAGDFNANLRSELQNAAQSADFTLDPEGGADTNLNMLGQTIALYANAGWYYAESGAANAYVLTRVGNLKSVPAYKDGMIVIFLAGNANTGASTINVDTLGVKDLELTGGVALTGGEIGADYVIARFHTSGDRFEVVYSVSPAAAATIRGNIDGLIMSNDTDTDHDINVEVGEANDSTNAVNIALLTEITKQIDATWAAGDDAGGMNDGETVAADTWYHVHILSDAAGTSVEIGFDTSKIAANLLLDTAVIAAGLTLYRRIGSVLTDGSSNIYQFIQIGNWFIWDDPQADFSELSGTTQVTKTIRVPLGVSVLAFCGLHANVSTMVYLRHPDTTDIAATNNVPPYPMYIAADTHDSQTIHTNESSQIRYRTRDNITLSLSTIYYVDRRGKDE